MMKVNAAASVLLAASLMLVVITMQRESPLPGDFTDSSFVRLSEEDHTGHQQFRADAASMTSIDPPSQPEEDISALVQEHLDWLDETSDDLEPTAERDAAQARKMVREAALHAAGSQGEGEAAVPEETLVEAMPDANSLVDVETQQVKSMQTQEAKDVSGAHGTAAILAADETLNQKKLGEAQALQAKLDSEIQDEQQQVHTMLGQHARDVARRTLKREARVDAAVVSAKANEKVRQSKRKLQQQAHKQKKRVRKVFQRKAKMMEKRGTTADKVAVTHLRTKRGIQKRRIETAQKELSTHTAAANEAVVVKGAQAEENLETSKMKHKLQVVSMDSGVRVDLPKKIPGLTSQFHEEKALKGTKSHPFKEAALRHAGLKYNKLRQKVVHLTDRLSKLEQEAADAAAKKQFEHSEELSHVVLHRQQDQAQDELELARFPKSYRDKIKAIQRDMFDGKMKAFRKEREARLKKEEVKDEAIVEEDEKEIATVKSDLKQVLHKKIVPVQVSQAVQASILQEVPDQLDTTTVPDAEAQDASGVEEKNPQEVITMLAREVEALQNQQEHLVEALTKKRIVEGATSSPKRKEDASPKRMVSANKDY